MILRLLLGPFLFELIQLLLELGLSELLLLEREADLRGPLCRGKLDPLGDELLRLDRPIPLREVRLLSQPRTLRC